MPNAQLLATPVWATAQLDQHLPQPATQMVHGQWWGSAEVRCLSAAYLYIRTAPTVGCKDSLIYRRYLRSYLLGISVQFAVCWLNSAGTSPVGGAVNVQAVLISWYVCLCCRLPQCSLG